MKKVFSISLLVLTLSVCAAAQNRLARYSFDNFSSGGITVISPSKPAAKPSLKLPVSAKKLSGKSAAAKPAAAPAVKRTVQQRTSRVEDSLAMSDIYKSTASTASVKTASGSSKSMHGFTTGDSTIDSYIVASCLRYGIDPLLIYAQMHQESSFKLRATSYKGARGLMQLMPATAARMGVSNIYDPQQNIEGGVKYMRFLLDTFNGDVDLALAGYNAGEGAVMRYGNSIPPYNETQEYVRRISARYDMLRNPNTPRQAARMTSASLAKLEKKDAIPLNLYERAVYAVKMPDGRMRLVSQ